MEEQVESQDQNKVMTTEELYRLGREAKQLRDQADKLEKEAKELNEAAEKNLAILCEHLRVNKLPNIRFEDFTVYVDTRYIWETPEEPQALAEFNAWLKETDRDHWRTVNYQVLQSNMNTLKKQADENGQDSFAVPGMRVPSEIKKARIRRK